MHSRSGPSTRTVINNNKQARCCHPTSDNIRVKLDMYIRASLEEGDVWRIFSSTTEFDDYYILIIILVAFNAVRCSYPLLSQNIVPKP